MKKFLINLSKKNKVFRKIFRALLYIYHATRYQVEKIGKKTDEKLIVFSTFNGKSYADSSKAIYEYMVNNPKFKDYKFVWGFKQPEKYSELKRNTNTIVVKQNSHEYEKYLVKAKYWFFNFRTAEYHKPKKDQVYVQCWHGTPLKKLGYDLTKTDNALNTTKELKNKYKSDAKKFKYMISPSDFTTEKLISSFNLKALGKADCVIQEGYPRNDFLINHTQDDIIRIKEKLNIENCNKKIILYAPTWRDNQHEAGVGYTYKTEVDFDMLQEKLQDDYIILFRAHYFVANQFDFEKYKGFIYNVSDVDDINELYVISDMLITDYSSVFFDYANLKRPMLFYMYDLDSYANDLRGFYIDLNELPGKIVKTENDLIQEIERLSTNFVYDERYQKFNDKYNYLDDGRASERVVERIILGKDSQEIAKSQKQENNTIKN